MKQLLQERRLKIALDEQGEMPLVSVIMSCYNHERFVGEAVESVINQTYQNIEFIIADDGSGDGSVEILKGYSGHFSEEHYFEKNEGGRGAFLISRTKGKYVALMNSDDIWEPEKLEKQVMIMERNSKYSACFTWCHYTDENLNIMKNDLFCQNNKSKEEWLRQFFHQMNSLCHPSILIKRELYLDLVQEGRRAFRQLPDFAMWVRLVQKEEIYLIPEIFVKMRRHHAENTANVSGQTSQNINRHFNDLMYLWYSEIKEMDAECFRGAFQQDFINKKAESDIEISCEKFFLLKNQKSSAFKIVAMLLFFDLYKEFRIAKCFEEKYAFGRKDFYKFNGEIGIYRLEAENRSLSERNKQLENKLIELEKASSKKREKKRGLRFFRKES